MEVELQAQQVQGSDLLRALQDLENVRDPYQGENHCGDQHLEGQLSLPRTSAPTGCLKRANISLTPHYDEHKHRSLVTD